MIVKYLLLALATLVLVTASDPYFGTELSLKPLPKASADDVRELKWMTTDAFKPYLKDSDDRVSDIFRVSPYYYPNVNFWFLIYTQFASSHVVIHDRSNLSLIYKVLDFSHLHKKEIPKNTIYVLQQKVATERLSQMRDDLDELASNPFSLSPKARMIYRTIKNAGVDIPIPKAERSQFFLKLKQNLRTQTGQKNFIRDGIMRSLPYQHFLTDYFTKKNLPKELLAVPFLESSFNPKAHSKVNALGIWQFMPLIASYFVPKLSDSFDYRSSVGVASVSAAFLMSENFKIMKSWDLAVTAYNSGTKHLLKSKRELASSKASLEAIIKHSDSEHFGFASKNFYSEFLALAHTLAYREELFDDLHDHDRADVDLGLRFYQAKCLVRFHKELSKEQLDDVLYHNHHVSDSKNVFPRGFIVTSKTTLPKSKFQEISEADLLKKKPKDWVLLLKNQSCSTR